MSLRRRKRVRQETTVRKRRKNESLMCALCTAKVYYKTTGEIYSANEKDCFQVVLSLLELSSASILEIADDWDCGEFTFCAKCDNLVEEGLAMMKEVKELHKKIEVIREEVIAVLTGGKRNLQSGSRGSQIVKNILKQCFQPCVVPLEKATVNPKVCSISRKPRDFRKSTGNKTLKQVQLNNDGIPAVCSKLKSVTTETKTMWKDSMVADYGDSEGEEVKYGWCIMDGESNEDVHLAAVSANGSPDILEERYCASDEMRNASMRTQNVDTEDTVKRSVAVASLEVGLPVGDAVSLVRRSLRPRHLTQRVVGSAKLKEVEISKHACSVCKLQFNEKRELAKHYWSEHSARTTKNVYNLATPNADKNEAGASIELSEDSEGDEFVGLSDASSENSDGDHANKRNKKNYSHELTQAKKLPKYKKFIDCPFCAAMFDRVDEYDFMAHIYDEHKLTFIIDLYGCHKCGEVLGFETSDPKSSEFALSHMSCEESVEANVCKFCNYKAENFIQKLHHYHLFHKPETNCRCDICESQTILPTKRALQIHRSRSHGIPLIKISRKFTKSRPSHSASIVQLLNYYYSGRYEFEPECRVCDSSFEGRAHSAIVMHYRDHHNLHFHRGLYGCVVCNAIYDDDEDDNLKEFQECHKKCCRSKFPTQNCVCINCGEKVLEFRTLAHHHLRKHFELNRPPPQKYPCKFCQQMFRHEARLFDHIQKDHREVELIQLVANSQDSYQDFESEKAPGQLDQRNNPLPRTDESSTSHQQEQILAVVESDFGTTEIVCIPATDTLLSIPIQILNREISAAEFTMHELTLNGLQLQDVVLQPSDRSCLFCDFITEDGSFVALMAHVYASHQLLFLFELIGCKNCGAVKSKADLELQEFCEQHSNCASSPSANFCTVCNFKSSNFLQMMGHYKEAHFNGKIAWIFTCKTCDRRYCDNVEGLFRHLARKHRKPNLTSQVQQNRSLYPETPNFKPTEQERCALCPEVFSKATKQLLPNHVSDVHKLSYDDGTYGCSVCGVLYGANSKCGIDEFAREHEKCSYESHTVSLSCSGCGQDFQEFKTLVAHCKSHHEHLNQVWCFVCGESYVSVAALKAHYHLSNHLQQSKKLKIKVDVRTSVYRNFPPEGIPCELCDGSRFDGISRFYAHRRTVHNLWTKYDVTGCLTCHDIFIRKPGYALCDFKKEHETCTQNNDTAFDCKLCGKILQTTESKYHHYSYVHGNRGLQYPCRVCHQMFRSPQSRSSHMVKKHLKPKEEHETSVIKRNQLNPEEQERNVIKRNQLNPEEQESSPLFPFVKYNHIYYVKKLPEVVEERICELCMESFDPQLPAQLKNHLKSAHGLLLKRIQNHRLYLCTCCYAIYKPDENLSIKAFAEYHSMCTSATMDDGIPCKYCGVKCDTEKLLCNHHIEHHVEKTVECAGCTSKFASWLHLTCHMREKISSHFDLVKLHSSVSKSDVFESTEKLIERQPTYHCHICKTVLENQEIKRIGKHYRDHHSLFRFKREYKEYFACNGCNDICLPGTSLETELPAFVEAHKDCTYHRGNVVCKLCGLQFDYRFKYFAHYLVNHVNNKIVCHICGKSISSAQGGLTRHMYYHNKSHPFTCRICNQGCQDRRQLTRHLRRHTGEKPFVCDICGASFTLNCTLIHHRRLHGEQIRNVPCMECGKLFTNKKNVWSHVRDVHRRSRPPRTKKKSKPRKIVEEDTSDADNS